LRTKLTTVATAVMSRWDIWVIRKDASHECYHTATCLWNRVCV